MLVAALLRTRRGTAATKAFAIHEKQGLPSWRRASNLRVLLLAAAMTAGRRQRVAAAAQMSTTELYGS
jgi:hypothetical protein